MHVEWIAESQILFLGQFTTKEECLAEVQRRCSQQQADAASQGLGFDMPLCVSQTSSILDCANIGFGTRVPEEEPPKGGGGTRPPPACPKGQQRDSSGRCVAIQCPSGQQLDPATGKCVTPPTAGGKKKSNWGLALLGAAAVIAGAYALA